jgi:alpha-N-acetylglucosamine transferase
MKAEGISESEAIQKKSYVQICSLTTVDNSNFDYDQLAALLNIDAQDVEEWAIEAIANKIIDAKIDQMNRRVVIKSTMLKQLKTEEWKRILVKVQVWKEKFERMQTVLSAAKAQ